MPPPPVPPQASFPRSSQATQTPTSSAPGRRSESDTTLVEKPSERDLCAASPSSTLQTDIMESLKDDAGLYKLPKGDLEKLVASVIREEGFSELVSGCSPCAPWSCVGLHATRT